MNPRSLRLRHIAALLLLWWTIPPGKAQAPAESMTLAQCIDYAMQHNSTLKNAALEVKISDRFAKEQLASGLPQVNIAADLQYFAKLPTFFFPSPQQEVVNIADKPYLLTAVDPLTGFPKVGPAQPVVFGFPWQGSAGITLSQLVFDWRFFLGLKAADSFLELTQKQLDASSEEVAAQVSKAYYTALLARESLKLLDLNIERIQQLLKDTRAIFKEGFAEQLDIERLELALSNLELEKTKAQRMAAMSIDLLEFQMGMPVEKSLSLSEDIERLSAITPALPDSAGFDPRTRSNYKVLELAKGMQEYSLKATRANYMPSLVAFGSYQFNAQSDNLKEINDFQVGVVGLKLNVPVFDGTRSIHKMESERLKLRQIVNNQEMLRNSFAFEMRTAYAQLQNSITTLESYRKNAELARRVANSTEIKYKEGLGSSLEVNEAQSQLKQAEAAYLNARFEYLVHEVDLDKARGLFSQYQFSSNEN